MSVRIENLKRRRLTCLRCGRVFWTDRCHRVCKRCTADTQEPFIRAAVAAEGISVFHDLRIADELSEGPPAAAPGPQTRTCAEGSCEEVEA